MVSRDRTRLRATDREDGGGGVRELVQRVITHAAARCRDAGLPLWQSGQLAQTWGAGRELGGGSLWGWVTCVMFRDVVRVCFFECVQSQRGRTCGQLPLGRVCFAPLSNL